MPEPLAARNIAVLLLDAASLQIIWCNDEYAHMVDSEASQLIGRPYEEAVSVMTAVKVPVYRRIAETGVSESGIDYVFDLAVGTSAHHWQIERATPDLLVCVTDWACAAASPLRL